MSPLYQFACRYISAGLCPLPVWNDRRKNPRLNSIGAYRERLPTPAEWRRWSRAWPDSNLALLTGYHGLCALDFDDTPAFTEWLTTAPEPTRDTWIVATGRGYHVYFMAIDEPGKDRMFVRAGHRHEVLLRAKGAYVIAPPSVHYTGRRYRTVSNMAPVRCHLESIMAGWLEKTPANAGGGQRPMNANGHCRSARPNILDYVPAYDKTPNARGAFRAFCPFHEDKHPSAWVNPAQNRFGCNACFPGRWLDVVNVIALLHGHDNNELMRNLYHRGDALKFNP